MQSKHETLGEIIKNARIKADITVEDLAAKVGVTERFMAIPHRKVGAILPEVI